MADPASIATMSMGLSGAGTGLSVASALFGGKAKSEGYLYQAGVAKMNEKIQKQNAEWARTTGERENLHLGMKQGQRAGAIVAGQGASGIDLHSEGSKAVRGSQATVDRMDREQLQANVARRAYGYDMAAFSEGLKADAYTKASKNAKTEGYIKAATSLVSGATSVASKWYQGRDAGIWGSDEGLTTSDRDLPDYYGPDMIGALY